LRERDIELTDDANCSKDAENVGDCEVLVDRRAHVEEITHIEGMCSRLARIKRGRADPEEQAENWEDAEETHELVKQVLKCNEGRRSEDSASVLKWSFSPNIAIRPQIIYGWDLN
jgi:hypothetical protein